jgi:ATP-dependent helicase/nuclease subunit B
LAELLQHAVERYRSDYPPPNENAFRTQSWQLARIARVFLQAEAEFCRTSTPRYFEVALGLPGTEPAGPLDDPKPVPIKLPGGQIIHAAGRIDRIDESTGSPGVYSVWDYKTGSSARYDASQPFQQGRVVQNVLYALLAETALRRKVTRRVHVERCGYFFPGTRDVGLRIAWTWDELSAGQDVLERLCRLIASGAFLATDKADDCEYCEYRSVCGDIPAVTACSRELLNRSDIVVLQPLTELRRGG